MKGGETILKMYKVQKKDGRIEDFDRSKVLNGVVKSGASFDEAEIVTSGIEQWLPTVAKEGVITTTEIRTKVLEILREVNPQAAKNFENYQKPVT